MKIAFYINTMKSGGGAERVVSRLANYMCKNNNVTIITIVRESVEYNYDDSIGRVVLDEIESNKKNAISRIKKLRSVCEKMKPDILISFCEGASEFAVIATLLSKQKLIISLRNAPEHDFPSFTSRIIARALFSFSNGAVFQTKEICDWYPLNIRNKAKIILNPVEDTLYNTKWNPIKWRVVAVGRLTEQKNHKILIEAFAKVVKKFPEAELYIYGRGNLEQDLIQQIKVFDLERKVFLCGYTDDIYECISRANIFVLPSIVEGLPNALMEAMTIGVPSIATDCIGGGAKELLGDNEFGLLVDNNNLNAVEESLTMLLRNEQLQQNFSLKCREKSRSFNMDNIGSQWIGYIEKIITEKG